MNALVFATRDVTPEHWADFVKAARSDPDAPQVCLWVPIYSRSQPDTKSPTDTIPTTIKTELASATPAEIRALFTKLSEPGRCIYGEYYAILDKQSEEDRKIVFIHWWPKWIDPDGNVDDIDGSIEDGGTGVRQQTSWRRHRVPFDMAWRFSTYLSHMPGDEGEEYLESVEWEK